MASKGVSNRSLNFLNAWIMYCICFIWYLLCIYLIYDKKQIKVVCFLCYAMIFLTWYRELYHDIYNGWISQSWYNMKQSDTNRQIYTGATWAAAWSLRCYKNIIDVLEIFTYVKHFSCSTARFNKRLRTPAFDKISCPRLPMLYYSFTMLYYILLRIYNGKLL